VRSRASAAVTGQLDRRPLIGIPPLRFHGNNDWPESAASQFLTDHNFGVAQLRKHHHAVIKHSNFGCSWVPSFTRGMIKRFSTCPVDSHTARHRDSLIKAADNWGSTYVTARPVAEPSVRFCLLAV